MTLLAALLMLLAAVMACLPLVLGARRLLRGGSRSRHHEIGTAVFLQLGAIYAVLLAFIFNEVYAEYVVAAQAINRECAGLHAAAMLSGGLPVPADRDRMRDALERYVRDVVVREWPAMAEGRSDGETLAAQETLLRVAGTLPAAAAGTSALRSAILEQLLAAHENRETRLFEMTLTVPALVWVLLVCITVVLVTLLLLADIETLAPQIALTAAFVGAIVFFLLVIRLLDDPFEGPLRLSPDDFRQTLQRIDA